MCIATWNSPSRDRTISDGLLPARLLLSWRRTEYEAAGAVARIGRRSAAIDALLRRLGVREAAFVTAWNPYGTRAPPGRNARMQARLRAALRGVPIAEGHGRGRGWAEAHLLAGVPEARARVLARRFRQLGFVTVRRGRAARLRISIARNPSPRDGNPALFADRITCTEATCRVPTRRVPRLHRSC